MHKHDHRNNFGGRVSANETRKKERERKKRPHGKWKLASQDFHNYKKGELFTDYASLHLFQTSDIQDHSNGFLRLDSRTPTHINTQTLNVETLIISLVILELLLDPSQSLFLTVCLVYKVREAVTCPRLSINTHSLPADVRSFLDFSRSTLFQISTHQAVPEFNPFQFAHSFISKIQYIQEHITFILSKSLTKCFQNIFI